MPSNKMICIMILTLLSLLIPFVHAGAAVAAESCSSNSMWQTHTTTGPVAINTSPTAPFEDVKLSAINQTAWESYSFEGISSAGDSGVSINFYRSPSMADQGNGVLGVQINAVWQNGTQWSTTLWQNQSIILGCDAGNDVASYGFWDGTDNSDFSFVVPRTLATANVYLSGADVKGSLQLTRLVPPMTTNASGTANPHGSVQLAPFTYWNEPIPMAKANATMYFSGTEFDLQGFGGHWRNWAAYGWDSLARSWYRIRAVVGPYTLVYWTYTSAVDGQTYTTGMLMLNGTNVFNTAHDTPKSGSRSTMFWLTYNGAVHGSYQDTSTGIVVQVIGYNGKEWRFELEHTNVLSESQGGMAQGYSSFVNTVSGGEIDEAPFKGIAISDQADITTPAPI